jgi:hypothetical protein
MIGIVFQIKTIDSILVGKHRKYTAHNPNAETMIDVEALLQTRRLLMHDIDCVVPKHTADSPPTRGPTATDAFDPTPGGALLTRDFGKWRGQLHAAAAPCLVSKKADSAGVVQPKPAGNAGAVQSSPAIDAGVVIDAILHITAHFRRNLPRPLDSVPSGPGTAGGHRVQELLTAKWSIDPFHDDWPHW